MYDPDSPTFAIIAGMITFVLALFTTQFIFEDLLGLEAPEDKPKSAEGLFMGVAFLVLWGSMASASSKGYRVFIRWHRKELPPPWQRVVSIIVVVFLVLLTALCVIAPFTLYD